MEGSAGGGMEGDTEGAKKGGIVSTRETETPAMTENSGKGETSGATENTNRPSSRRTRESETGGRAESSGKCTAGTPRGAVPEWGRRSEVESNRETPHQTPQESTAKPAELSLELRVRDARSAAAWLLDAGTLRLTLPQSYLKKEKRTLIWAGALEDGRQQHLRQEQLGEQHLPAQRLRHQRLRGQDAEEPGAKEEGLINGLPQNGTLAAEGSAKGRRLPAGTRVVFKAYLHRSLLSQRAGILRRPRVRREYEALVVLEEGGVRCTEALFWGQGKSPIHGRFEVLATREIAGARSIRDAVLSSARAGDRGDRGDRSSRDLARNSKDAAHRLARDGMSGAEVTVTPELLGALARQVQQMHRLGVYHGALSWKNVLVSPSAGGGLALHVIDMARVIRFSRDICGTRMGWFDLMHLSYHLAQHLGKDVCRRLAGEYGLDGAESERLIRALESYGPERKIEPGLRRAEFAARAWVSRALPGRRA